MKFQLVGKVNQPPSFPLLPQAGEGETWRQLDKIQHSHPQQLCTREDRMLQRVMITAGGSGIGWAIARAFADNGAKVHICDVDERALGEATEKYPQIAATHLDVTDEEAIDQWFDDAIDDLDGLDVLVNNA